VTGYPYGSNPETCPVRTVQAWLEHVGADAGPLFRSINRHGRVRATRLSAIDVARVVKKLALRAGLDPAKYAGHFCYGPDTPPVLRSPGPPNGRS
jgi:hypothetical protein